MAKSKTSSNAFIAARVLVIGTVAVTASWAVWGACAWLRYRRHSGPASAGEADPLLDSFMPEYDVVDRYALRVSAPPDLTFDIAANLDFQRSRIIQGIFRARAVLLRSEPALRPMPRPLIDWAKALGWGVLAQIPHREIIMGAAVRPWESNVIFRPLPPGEFAAFHEPGYTKIAWTLRTGQVEGQTVVRTETRVATTDAFARVKFRRYWAFLSPGILLIRRVALRIVRREAERAATSTSP